MKNKLSDYLVIILLVFIICVFLYDAWTWTNILFKIAACFLAAWNLQTLETWYLFCYKNWKAERFKKNIRWSNVKFPQNAYSELLRKNNFYNGGVEQVRKDEKNIRDNRQND